MKTKLIFYLEEQRKMVFNLLCDDISDIILKQIEKEVKYHYRGRNWDTQIEDCEDYEEFIEELIAEIDEEDLVIRENMCDIGENLRITDQKGKWEYRDGSGRYLILNNKKTMYKKVYNDFYKIYNKLIISQFKTDYKSLLFNNEMKSNELEILKLYKPKGYKKIIKKALRRKCKDWMSSNCNESFCNVCKSMKIGWDNYGNVQGCVRVLEDFDYKSNLNNEMCMYCFNNKHNNCITEFYDCKEGKNVNIKIYRLKNKLIDYNNVLYSIYDDDEDLDGDDWDLKIFNVNDSNPSIRDVKFHMNDHSRWCMKSKIFAENMKHMKNNPKQYSKEKLLNEITLFQELEPISNIHNNVH